MTALSFTATLSNLYADESERYITYFGTLAISNAAHTYSTGGATTSFSGLQIPQNASPVWVDIQSRGPSTGALSNVYRYVPGTTIANGKVMVFCANGGASGLEALNELTASTAANDAKVRLDYDTPYFKATFRKGK